MVLAVSVFKINSLTQKSDVGPEKRTTGGRGRQAAFSSAVKANVCFFFILTSNSYTRPNKPFKEPRIFNKYMSAADSLLPHVLLSSMSAATVCLRDDLSVFTRMSLISLLQQRVEYIILWKLSAENTCCSSFCEKKRSEDYRQHSRHAAIKHPLQKRLKWQFCHMH